MKKINILCIALLTAGIASASVVGIDNWPDYRGDDNSVHAIFEVPPLVVGIPPPPDEPILFETVPSIYPLAQIAPGILNDGISAVITLPNFIDDLPMKQMRIQMEFYEPIFGRDIWIDVIGVDPVGFSWNIVGGLEPIFDSYHYVDIEISPNPDYETIWIGTWAGDPAPLTLITIDTVSIPEPASIGLLGLISGGIYFTRRFFIV